MSEESDEREEICKVTPDFFKGIHFCLCDDVENAETVKKILVDGGGKLVNYLSDIATHLIADNPDHPDVSEAIEIYEKPVVTSLWVWLSAKAECILPTAPFNPQKNTLFFDVVACPSNLCKDDLESVWAMITYYGGSFVVNLNSKVTHLVTTKTEGLKYEKSSEIKVVTPDWIVDSIKMRHLCDEEMYHPRLLLLPNAMPSHTSEENSTGVEYTPQSDVQRSTAISSDETSSYQTSTHVTLKTVSLPQTTFITTVPVSSSSQVPGQQTRFRLLVPPQHNDGVTSTPSASQPRQVYLTLHQQPQIRQQSINFIQIRQPKSATTEAGQTPVKPIILQQRIQPPVHQQQPHQTQALLVHNQSQNEGDKDHQMQQITSVSSQSMPHPMQQPANQITLSQDPSRQIQGNQILPPQSPQYQQMQNVNLNKSISQSAYQVRPGIQPISGVPQQVQYQAINDPNQVRLVQSQTQMVQLPRQMSPMGQQQRPPPHLQQIKQVTGPQTMMRIPQQSQFFQTQTQPNQDQMMHDVQGPAIRMMAGQQMVHLREQNPQLIMNVQQPQGGSGMIGNISQQQIVFQHPNNQVGLNQRPQVQQVMTQSGQMYNQHGQPIRVAQSQVPRVPQLRIPPNFQNMPRGQIRNQFRGQNNQQVMSSPVNRQYLKNQGQNINQGPRQQYSPMFHQQNASGHPPQVSHQSTHQLHQIQSSNPDGTCLPSVVTDKLGSSQTHPPQSLAGSIQSPSNVQMEVHAMPSNQVMNVQPNINNWNQQWPPNAENSAPVLQNNQRPIVQPPQQISISQQHGPGMQKIQFPQPDNLAKTSMPTGVQPAVRSIPPSGARRFLSNVQPGDHIRAPNLIASPLALSNVRLSVASPQGSHDESSPTTDSIVSSLASLSTTSSSPSAISSPTTTSTLVTPKTKTTLANFLNTRLQNNASVGASVKQSSEGANSQTPVSSTSSTSSSSSSSSQSHSGDGSCYTSPVKNSPLSGSSYLPLSHNKLGINGSHGVIANGEFTPRPFNDQPQIQHERLFGHEPRTIVPPELCLSGCVFTFIESTTDAKSATELDCLDLCKKVVIKYGGQFENSYTPSCTHVVCDSQEHNLVRQALKDGKRCVTMHWISDIITEGRLRPPYKIWHIPKAFDGNFRPCRDHIITISNFEGRDRVLLKDLIKQTGATYTSYLTRKNTLLISKRAEGNKFKKTIEWDMPVVNVLWLQDVLFGHHLAALTALNTSNKSIRYTKFDPKDTKDPCDLDYNLVRTWMSPWRVPIKVSQDFGERKLNQLDFEKKHNIQSLSEPMDVEKAGREISTSNSNPSNNSNNSSTPSTTSQPMVDAVMTDDTKISLEKNIKSENTQDESSNMLHSEPTPKKVRLSPEIPLEKSGYATQETRPSDSILSSTPTNATSLTTPTSSLVITPLIISHPENISVKIILSGCPETETQEYTKMASSLGLTITSDYTQCTHLVMPKITRTAKFLCSFSHAKHIIHPNWLMACAKQRHLVDEQQFYLNDIKGENYFGFNLKESLQKRNARGTPLFKGFIFCITKSCIPSFKILKDIVESAGALGATRKIPSVKQLKQLQRKEHKFVVISKEEDLPICDIFFNRHIPVLNTEFILHNLLTQEICYEPYTFKKS